MTLRLLGICLASLLLWNCSSEDTVGPCQDERAISLGNGSCLLIDDDPLLQDKTDLIQSVLQTTYESVDDLLPAPNLSLIVISDASRTISGMGVGGYNPDKHTVLLFLDSDFTQLETVIREGLPYHLAHEIHHAVRRRHTGYGSTLGEALISEGLADVFAQEVLDVAPQPWSLALSEEDIDFWTEESLIYWDKSYDHGKWFFGSDGEIPYWTGYSVGYSLVQQFISGNPGARASILVSTPAEEFRPEE